jgi:benzil reductase ((S)-benzoin forming)
MKYFIITGASRGLGEALARKLLDPRHHLFCISRSDHDDLIRDAEVKGAKLTSIAYDLAKYEGLERLMEEIAQEINADQAERIILINNAAVVSPVKPIHKCTAQELSASLHINVLAPMILSAAFIKWTTSLPIPKRILNISSGAGKRPVEGWSAYCSTKAALDLFTRCVGLEQQREKHPVEIVSISPGIIDTPMQAEIRSAKETDFPDLEQFVAYKKNGQLQPAQRVAEKLVKFLYAPHWPNGGVISIQDL